MRNNDIGRKTILVFLLLLVLFVKFQSKERNNLKKESIPSEKFFIILIYQDKAQYTFELDGENLFFQYGTGELCTRLQNPFLEKIKKTEIRRKIKEYENNFNKRMNEKGAHKISDGGHYIYYTFEKEKSFRINLTEEQRRMIIQFQKKVDSYRLKVQEKNILNEERYIKTDLSLIEYECLDCPPERAIIVTEKSVLFYFLRSTNAYFEGMEDIRNNLLNIIKLVPAELNSRINKVFFEN